MAGDLAWYSHAQLQEVAQHYEYPASHEVAVGVIGMDTMLPYNPELLGLFRFGDIVLTQRFTAKLAKMFAGADWSAVPSLVLGPMLATIRSSSFYAQIGTRDASLSLLHTFGLSFGGAQDAETK